MSDRHVYPLSDARDLFLSGCVRLLLERRDLLLNLSVGLGHLCEKLLKGAKAYPKALCLSKPDTTRVAANLRRESESRCIPELPRTVMQRNNPLRHGEVPSYRSSCSPAGDTAIGPVDVLTPKVSRCSSFAAEFVRLT